MKWNTIGFAKQKETFGRMIENHSLSHAYIFQGEDQIGKKQFALDLFRLANKRGLSNLADPDLYIVAPRISEGETKIYIEDIRDLKTFLSLKSFYGPYRFVIIDDAHRLTSEASNAFLKLLEEPTQDVVFILITSQPQELMPTISSRGQHIFFLPHESAVVLETLSESKLSKDDQELVTALARGRIGWALSTLQNSNLKEIKRSIADFKNVLKSPLAERMLFAKTMFEKQPYLEEVSYWLTWAYANRDSLDNAHRVLSQLLTLHQYINQPQYNHRALLENTLINL